MKILLSFTNESPFVFGSCCLHCLMKNQSQTSDQKESCYHHLLDLVLIKVVLEYLDLPMPLKYLEGHSSSWVSWQNLIRS